MKYLEKKYEFDHRNYKKTYIKGPLEVGVTISISDVSLKARFLNDYCLSMEDSSIGDDFYDEWKKTHDIKDAIKHLMERFLIDEEVAKEVYAIG